MSNTMRHWNAHQLCAIDVETTGTKPYWHEIVQISAVALDSKIQPRKDIMPFDVFLRPYHPERVDPEAMRVTGLSLEKLMLEGHDPLRACDMFERWVERLELGCTPGGNQKRIMPLAHNWSFDKPFLQDWLGHAAFDHWFDGRARDTMIISLFLNDHANFLAEVVPYSKNTLSWLAKKLNIDHRGAHNSLKDCIITAEVYRRLCQLGLSL